MATTHTVAQGETLTRIAHQCKYASWKKIYEHPDNTDFRKLRNNPDVIFPGDEIVIPDIKPKNDQRELTKGNSGAATAFKHQDGGSIDFPITFRRENGKWIITR